MASLDQVEDGLEDANENSLKPCPFCGGKAEFFTIEKGRDKGAHFIQCTNPACETSTNLQWSLKEDARPMLAERWNERADTIAKTDALQSLLKEAVDVLEPFARAVDAVDAEASPPSDEMAVFRASLDYSTRHLGFNGDELISRDSVRLYDLRRTKACRDRILMLFRGD